MKAIILAAGKGTRLNKYTQDLPKGMLKVFEKSIIEHQIEAYTKNGISDITIITGYMNDKINFKGVEYFYNDKYADTNMIESLFCAKEKISGDVIISYSDILFEDSLLKAMIKYHNNIGVAVDRDWKDYWHARYGKVDFDTESLKINENNEITELGIIDPPLDEIDGRYIGMIRLNAEGSKIFNSIYTAAQKKYSGKEWLNGRLFEKIYMTDFLQEIINKGNVVQPVLTTRGWLEFDTNEDYEKVLELNKNGTLNLFYKK